MLHKNILKAFNEIHDFAGYDFPNIASINFRLCNCFFKAFVKKCLIVKKNKKCTGKMIMITKFSGLNMLI